MGIPRLSEFMKNNPNLHQEFKLHSTNVVIDGNSLYHFIFHHNQVDFLHGGDYDQYALKIREFFELLKSCNIQPYVVFDGGNDPNNMKLDTTRRRLVHRLDIVKQLAKNIKTNEGVVPILAFDTFKEVLHEMNTKLAVCDFEADKEIGLLANELNCPVLSSDSDFFVLPLNAGFIQLDRVKLALLSFRTEKGSLKQYLPAEIYYVDEFVQFFPSGREVLPVLATFLGNDYVDTKVFKSFYSSISKINFLSKFRISNSVNKINKVIPWLETVETFNDVVLKMEQFDKPSEFFSAFEMIKKAYTFSEDENKFSLYSLFWEELPNGIRKPMPGFNGSIIPSWYFRQHRKGNLPPRSIDIITTHSVFLTPQMEIMDKKKSPPSSYHCSEKLRAFMYGILLSEDILGLRADLAMEKNLAVEEYDHKDNFKNGRFVSPLQTLPQYGALPKLSDIEGLPALDKKKILDTILNIHSFSNYQLTADLELVMGIVLFWIKESKPKVTLNHLKSVIVCMIMIKVEWILSHQGATGSNDLIEAKVKEMTRKGLERASTNFSSFNAKPEHDKENAVNCRVIHGFAQLQTCIMATMHLNSLLLHPFPSPCIPHIFSGTFLYNFCLELEQHQAPEEFIHELLLKDSKLKEAYLYLLDAVIEAIKTQGQELATMFECIDYEGRSANKKSLCVENSPLTTSNRFSILKDD